MSSVSGWKQALAIAACAALGSWSTATMAQGMPRGNMPPEMQAKMQAWRTWQQSHRNVMGLTRMLSGIQRLDQTPATRLTKPQAASLLKIIHTWSGRSALTEAQAQKIGASVRAALSPAQRQALEAGGGDMRGPGGGGMGRRPGAMGRPPGGMGRPQGGGFGGRRPGGFPGRPGGSGPGGRPGAGGGMGMNPMDFPPPPKGSFNPLKPSTVPIPRMRDMATRRLSDLISELNKRAH